EFFFSSRRRHTRFSRDWSSDVCSSDLRFTADQIMTANPMTIDAAERFGVAEERMREAKVNSLIVVDAGSVVGVLQIYDIDSADRSEERRVGKEWRARG